VLASSVARNETLVSLERLVGTNNVHVISVTTEADSLANAATDPLADIDVIYNAGQNYPANTTAQARLQAFFARGGGYIGTSLSLNNFNFLTGAALLATPLTQGSDTASGGITVWNKVGAGGPLLAGYPSQDFLYMPSNITFFSATPTDAVIDANYLPSSTDMFLAGVWVNREIPVPPAGKPIAVHGVTNVNSRYAGLSANPFSRVDAEREWLWVGQAALWTNLTDE